MGSDDLFKKRRTDRKRRKYEFKTPRANSFLIVTEGQRIRGTKLHGAINLLSIGYICMLIIVILHFIEKIGKRFAFRI